jgi:hypothetical protein
VQNNWTPLHSAVCIGQLACAQLLLERGADICAVNIVRSSSDAAAQAARQPAPHHGLRAVLTLLRSLLVTRLLRDAQAGEMPLHTAVGHTACLAMLLDRGGVDVDAQNSVRGARLVICTWCTTTLPPQRALTPVAPSAAPQRGETPLIKAAESGRVRCSRLLLERGANTRIVSDVRASPLLLACNAPAARAHAVNLAWPHARTLACRAQCGTAAERAEAARQWDIVKLLSSRDADADEETYWAAEAEARRQHARARQNSMLPRDDDGTTDDDALVAAAAAALAAVKIAEPAAEPAKPETPPVDSSSPASARARWRWRPWASWREPSTPSTDADEACASPADASTSPAARPATFGRSYTM